MQAKQRIVLTAFSMQNGNPQVQFEKMKISNKKMIAYIFIANRNMSIATQLG